MALTAGVVTLVSKTQNTVNLSATAATGGTDPVAYQWYRSTVTGFTPGAGNILAGKTALTLADSGLVPGTTYFYVLKGTDSAGSPAVVLYTQFTAVTSVPTPNINSFQQSSIVGMIDLRFDYDTVSAQIDASATGEIAAGQAVKIVDSADGVPKVVPCSANSDDCFGFINYDIKTRFYLPGSMCEISQAGNVMYLYSTGAISRGARVQLDLSTRGGVAALTGASGADIVGWAFDKASAAGQLIRVRLLNPSFTKA